MYISLPPDIEKFVEDRVRTGQYTNPTEVIVDALEAFRSQQQGLPIGEDLERLIAEGEAEAGRGDLLDGAQVFRNLLARNAERTR
jgi:antitoxin ParD1/3/4